MIDYSYYNDSEKDKNTDDIYEPDSNCTFIDGPPDNEILPDSENDGVSTHNKFQEVYFNKLN